MGGALNFLFWFLLVNFISFLPFYIFNFREQKGFFNFLSSGVKSTKDKLKCLYARDESDFLRINLDLLLLCIPLLLIPFLAFNKLVFYVLVLMTMFGLVYNIYIAIMVFVFKRIPDFKSDISFIEVGFHVARDKIFLVFIALLLTLLVLGFLSFFLSSQLINSIQQLSNAWLPLAIMIPLLFLGFYNFRSYAYNLLHYKTVISPIQHVFKNFQFSKRFKFILDKDQAFFESKNIYSKVTLDKKPNLIIIAIESYGSIIHENDLYKKYFEQRLQKMQARLAEGQWHSASILSDPPLFAGGSWLSYSTFLYGIRLDDLALYNLLFQNHKPFFKYESLLHFCKRNEYKNYLLSPIGGYDGTIDWGLINRSYQTDYCFGFNELEYTGKTMQYINFGKVMPDQYALNFAYDKIKKESEPYSLFFTTVNSHCFFDSPLSIEDDWKSYNTKDFETTGQEKKNLSDKYKKAINYQLDLVEDFLLNEDLEDTIVVLFGDHQPPFIAKSTDGRKTPIHVISKNEQFLKPFVEAGFSREMWLGNKAESAFNHEGFYSLFMQSLLKVYSNSNDDFEYLPDGVDIKS